MTVSDLIEELEQLPPDLPVVSCYKEVTNVIAAESSYYFSILDKNNYTVGPCVLME